LVYTEPVQSSVKERLTGALILIVALVIVVPELFSGRPEKHPATDAPDAQSADAGPPLRSYTMDLEAGQTAQAAQSAKLPEPVASAAEIPAPVDAKQGTDAAPSAPAATATSPAPVIAESPPAEKPPATKPAAATPAVQAHGWWVQLGSFSARANADRLAGSLGSSGYSVRVSPTTKNGKELYRVLAGPSDDRAAAVALQARLAAAGHKGTLVAP
jgi:cell division septation protein DedD